MTTASRRLRSTPLRLAIALVATALACKAGPRPEEGTATPDDATAAVPVPADPVIDAARMLADLETLSADDLAGRFTFSENLDHASDLLVAEYRAAGIAPVGDDYRVPFMAPNGTEPGDDVTVWVQSGRSHQVAGDRIVSLGNGGGEPAYADVVGVASLGSTEARAVEGKIVLAPSPSAGELSAAVEAFAAHGPAGLVLVGEHPAPDPGSLREALGALSFPIVWLDREAVHDWMGVTFDRKGAPKVPGSMKVSMAAKREDVQEQSFNVLAQIPGTEHPEQIVMLGAHYDHIGTTDEGLMCRPDGEDGICNGADDNASGTAMVLEIARAFADAGVRPARTIVFAHFAGEELGLLGSRALANHPPAVAPFEGGQVVAMVNLDMVGRLGQDGLAIGGVSSSDEWMPLLDELGSRGMPVVYERAINGRSDHASFYRKKIPVLFFFTGLHDDYHRAGDHSDKINREDMASIGQLVADLVHVLGGGHAIAYAEPRSDQEGVVMRMPGADDASVEKRTEGSATGGR